MEITSIKPYFSSSSSFTIKILRNYSRGPRKNLDLFRKCNNGVAILHELELIKINKSKLLNGKKNLIFTQTNLAQFYLPRTSLLV